jgi:hypothetical protein
MSDMRNKITLDPVADAYIIKELCSKTPKFGAIKALIAEMFQRELPLDNIWRVELRDNHEVNLTDFTMPSSSDKLKQTIPITDAPKFIRDGLAILQIARDDAQIEGVGKRISDTVYYIVERNDGGYSREEGERCS